VRLCRDGGTADRRAFDPIDMADDTPRPERADRTVDDIIADCDGDARAAVGELLAIIRSLIHENPALRESASPGFARRRPIVFGKSS
jgi:hypothetical protein